MNGFRAAAVLAAILLAAAPLRADEHGRWEQMATSTSGFGGTFGGNWVFHCKYCGKPYVIPTRNQSEARAWAYNSHVPACNPAAKGAGGAAAPARSLQELGVEAISKGIVYGDRQMVAQGSMAVAADLFLNMLFSTPSGPTPEQAARQRLRESERINRQMNARADAEFLQNQILGNSARFRAEYELRDAERSDRLGGAFDVVPRRSTPFFGSPAGASDEEIAQVLAEDLDPFGAAIDGRGTPADFEAMLRILPHAGDGVPLDGFPAGIDPGFLEDGRRRAAETEAYHRAHLPPDRLPPLAADGRYVSPIERLQDRAEAYALEQLEEFRRKLLNEISISGFQNARDLYEKQKKFAEELFRGLDPERLARAAVNGEAPEDLRTLSERVGLEHLRRLANDKSGKFLSSDEAVGLATGSLRVNDWARASVVRNAKAKASDLIEEHTGITLETGRSILQGGAQAVERIRLYAAAPPPAPAPAPRPVEPPRPEPPVRYALAPGVTLAPRMQETVASLADEYHKATGKSLTVTSGSRTPEGQAAAMFRKLEGTEGLQRYVHREAAAEIQKAYDEGRAAGRSDSRIKAEMTDVIERQMARRVYISDHLKAGAVDIRSRDMSPAEQAAFQRIVERTPGYKACLEGSPPHFHLEEK